QEVVPFDIFFGSGSNVRDAVAAMIASEDPSSPYSDQAIAEELVTRGMVIARRTVVKYREEMRIPASYLRRKR
ncbi:MAG: RNA polymerase sigma-54 factor, partial [Capsulimonadaceae bacterium]